MSPQVGQRERENPLLKQKRTLTLIAFLVFGSALVGHAAARESAQRQTGIGVVRYGLNIANTPVTSRYSYVIGGPADTNKMRSFNGTGLVYKSSMDLDTTCQSDDMCPTGVTYAEAAAKGWVLKDGSGEIACPTYPKNRLADVGSRDFQRRWLQNVLHFMHVHRAKGLFIDNVLGNVDLWSGGRYPQKYPNNAAWENAMASFIAYVGPRLKADGIYVVVNALKFISGDPRTEDGTIDAQWWRRIGPNVSGLLSEHWQQSPIETTRMYTVQPGDWTGHWDGWERLVDVAQSMHRDFFGQQWGTSDDVHLLRYGRASFLLAWDGKGGAFVFAAYDAKDPASGDWAAAIGKPVDQRQRVGVGWQRLYSDGMVVLNPSQTVAQTFRFARAYRTPDGAAVRQVQVAPASALILRRA